MLLKNAIVLEKQSSRRRYNCVQSIQPRIGFVSRLNLGHLVLSTGATIQLVASLPVATPHLLVFCGLSGCQGLHFYSVDFE